MTTHKTMRRNMNLWLILVVVCCYAGDHLYGGCSLPPCQKIDAAVRWSSNNKTYFFSGDEYIIHNDYRNAEEDVYNVSTIANNFPTNIDAAVNWFGRHFSLYFKGCYFFKLHEVRQRILRRRRLSRLQLPCDVDAAVNIEGQRILIFKGCQYWTISRSRRRSAVPTGSVSDLGLPCDVDAALTWSNGTSYVIKGDVVWPLTSRDTAGTPQSLDDWNLCSWNVCEGGGDVNATEGGGFDDEDGFPCNGDKRFCQLRFDQTTLAGSHNAGSGFDGGFGLLSCWVQNQALSVLGQLRLGIRYLDVDTSWQDCGLLGTYHNAFCGGPICKMIKQIKRFLRENRHEVIAINFNHEMRDHDRVIPALVRQLTSQVGNYVSNYYRYFRQWPSLRHAVTSNKRLFVIMDRRVTSMAEYPRHLWVHASSLLQNTWRGDVTVYGDCNQVVNSSRFWCEARQHAPLLEVSILGSSTSCVSTIADLCLPLVQNISRDCSAPRHSQGRAPNILLVDYPERAPRTELSVVHAAFLQNVRNVAVLSRGSCVSHVRAAVTWPEVQVGGEHLVLFLAGSRYVMYNWNISLQLYNHSRLVNTSHLPLNADATYRPADTPTDVCFVHECNVTCIRPVTSASRHERRHFTLASVGLPCSLHAAFTRDGVSYFLQGCSYWKIDPVMSPLATGPYPIAHFGLPCDVTAALGAPDGNTYFFKGDNYWKYTDSGLQTPQSVLEWSADFVHC